MTDYVTIRTDIAAEGERLVAQMIANADRAAEVAAVFRKLVPERPAGREELR